MQNELLEAITVCYKTDFPSRTFSALYKHLIHYVNDQTLFLPKDAKLSQRLWHIKTNTYKKVKCENCENDVVWSTPEYRRFCSKQCCNKNATTEVLSLEETKVLLATVDNEQLRTIGRTNPLLKNSIKTYAPNIKNLAQAKIVILNNGVIPICPTCKIKELAWEPSESRYRFYCSKKCGAMSETTKTRRADACMLNFGVPHQNKQEMSILAISRISNPIWLNYQHTILKKAPYEIAKQLSMEISGIYKTLDKYNIPIQSYHNKSAPESTIRYLLDKHNVDYVCNSRQIITPLELDIFIPSHNIAIEICGVYWHSDKHPRFKDRTRHLSKLQKCNDLGIRLLTIFDDEILLKLPIVEKMILRTINKSTEQKIHARKCIVKNIEQNEANTFLNDNHILGATNAGIRVGLIFDNKLVGLICFLKEDDQTFKLTRYATSCCVRGGFSKLLKYCKQNLLSNMNIITFADRRISEGDLYIKHDFKQVSVSSPNYSRTSYEGKFCIRKHRSHFTKAKLKLKLLDDYNDNLTEDQMCEARGWFKVWDCGLIKYQYNG